jgi:hypothetical protein
VAQSVPESYEKRKVALLQAWSGPEGSRKLRFPDSLTTAQEGKAVPLQACSCPEGSRKLRFPDFLTTAQEGKAGPLQACSCPEGSRKLRFPDFMTMEQDGGKVVSLTHRLHLSPGNTPGEAVVSRIILNPK